MKELANMQWRRQAWSTGTRAPRSLRMHANFAAVKTVAVLIFLTLSPRTSEHMRHAPVPAPPGAKFWRRHCKHDTTVKAKQPLQLTPPTLER